MDLLEWIVKSSQWMMTASSYERRPAQPSFSFSSASFDATEAYREAFPNVDNTKPEIFSIVSILPNRLTEFIANFHTSGESLFSYVSDAITRIYATLPLLHSNPVFSMIALIGISMLIIFMLLWLLLSSQQTSSKNEEREEECQLSTPESVESNEDRGSNDGYDISQAPLASSQAELMCCVAALEKYCRPFVDFETAHNTMNMRMSKIENMLSELSNRMNDIEQRGKEETALKIVNPSPCTASFVSITGHSTPKEMVISGTDHLSLLKHRIAAHCANIGGLATTSGDDTQFEVKDCMDNQWSYQSPSNSSELDDDTSPLLKPDTLMAYQPCQECEESATMKASDTVEYPINDASISSDTLILDTLFDDTTTTAKHNGQQEQQCDSAMLRKPNRSLYYQLEVQDTDTVAKYFYQNNALHGFTSPKRVCHYPTKHDSLNSLIGLVPDTSMSDSNTSMDNEMISSILSDASDISHLTDHVWDEMITEGQGTKPNVTMPINISCSIAEAKDELIRLINDMDAKKALIDSAEMRLNAVKEGIHQNTEQILANEAMIECYQSRIASVLSNRNSTMDELADVNARLSNTAKLSSHDIDQLQHQQQMHQTKIECAVIEFDVMHKRLEEITCKTKDLEEEKESFCQSYEKGCEFIEELKKEYDELEDEYEARTAALKDRYLEREQRQLQRDHWISGEELLVELEEARILSECQKLRPVDYNVPILI